MNTLERISQELVLGEDVFIAPGARVMGTVALGNRVSVWFNAVLRGDTEQITIGAGTNIQDGAVVHADPGDPAQIGEECVIGHLAIVHGACIGNRVLVGMHATVLNGARVGEGSIIGANALVPAGAQIPPYSLVLGVPAKVVKTLDPANAEATARNAAEYAEKAAAFRQWYNQGTSNRRDAD
jgi:carbonic anhydrase/acetyltransferase-like protein (isoleucine patch superfamily)